jgi:hypothetical protein
MAALALTLAGCHANDDPRAPSGAAAGPPLRPVDLPSFQPTTRVLLFVQDAGLGGMHRYSVDQQSGRLTLEASVPSSTFERPFVRADAPPAALLRDVGDAFAFRTLAEGDGVPRLALSERVLYAVEQTAREGVWLATYRRRSNGIGAMVSAIALEGRQGAHLAVGSGRAVVVTRKYGDRQPIRPTSPSSTRTAAAPWRFAGR